MPMFVCIAKSIIDYLYHKNEYGQEISQELTADQPTAPVNTYSDKSQAPSSLFPINMVVKLERSQSMG